MTEMGSAGTLGDLLASRRRRRFVGRASEVELFRVALESPEPPFMVLHIHGPPGIGKTRLLDVYAGLEADAGASVIRLDGRDLLPSPPAVLLALGVPEEEGAIVGPSGSGRLVVLFDTYERLTPLDDWVRIRLLPRLPASALTVIAGRAAPASAWRELLRVVSLRNLSRRTAASTRTPVAWTRPAMTGWSSWPMATRWGCRCWPTWSSAAARRPPTR